MSALAREVSDHNALVSMEDFERGSVDPDHFDHEAHIYVGWSYLQHYELDEAIDRFSAALRRLTKSLGIESKYHVTITWFFMILIAERRSGSEGWASFRRRNADLFAKQPSIIGRYYSPGRLGSPLARTQFVLPDRTPSLSEEPLDPAL